MLSSLHVTSAFDPIAGGIERFIADLAHAGERAGAFASRVLHVAAADAKPRLYRLQDVEVQVVPSRGVAPFWRLPDLRRTLCAASVVHLHDPQIAGIAWSLGVRQHLRPTVLSTHGGFFHTKRHAVLKRAHFRFVVPRLLERLEMVIASSASDEARFASVAPRLVRIENAIDFERFNDAASTRERDPLALVYVGRLAVNKRVHLLIDCVAALAARGRAVTLDLAGTDFDGLRETLAARALAAGIADRVRFLGPVDDAALLALLGRASFALSASEYEGFGLGAVEAMAAGVLPLLQPIAPFRRLLTADLADLLVDFTQPSEAALRIAALLDAPPARRGALRIAAIARAQEFAWSERVYEFAAAYARAMRTFQGARR